MSCWWPVVPTVQHLLTAWVLERPADQGNAVRRKRTGQIVFIRGYAGRDSVRVYDGETDYILPGAELELRP